jgi:hypothetical protein
MPMHQSLLTVTSLLDIKEDFCNKYPCNFVKKKRMVQRMMCLFAVHEIVFGTKHAGEKHWLNFDKQRSGESVVWQAHEARRVHQGRNEIELSDLHGLGKPSYSY